MIFDRAENRSCGRLLSEVFERKADYFLLTTTSEKTIALLYQEYKKYMKYCNSFPPATCIPPGRGESTQLNFGLRCAAEAVKL